MWTKINVTSRASSHLNIALVSEPYTGTMCPFRVHPVVPSMSSVTESGLISILVCLTCTKPPGKAIACRADENFQSVVRDSMASYKIGISSFKPHSQPCFVLSWLVLK
ncbi:hypothetical protein RRG08_050116 [Elysia crispata]|uniref:Uncharacterized protein n=1 Tax=Elysia crispata TaxID=231223 RepID=A0AAE0Z5T7_9GAST|nr:hypothetical protein RRG08_050116 [Elysia crispata]